MSAVVTLRSGDRHDLLRVLGQLCNHQAFVELGHDSSCRRQTRVASSWFVLPASRLSSAFAWVSANVRTSRLLTEPDTGGQPSSVDLPTLRRLAADLGGPWPYTPTGVMGQQLVETET